ncbi:hypothetical protein BURMUCF2_A0736 [Burkholderia multivorans CF2]|nr:hypothetical protein BURMUCF2_A0736 [Burkholderia multivorans CF2]
MRVTGIPLVSGSCSGRAHACAAACLRILVPNPERSCRTTTLPRFRRTSRPLPCRAAAF